MHDTELLRNSDLRRELKIGRSTIWRWVAEGRLPAPIRIGRVTAWRRSDIAALIERLAGQRAA